ncbi:MAG: hypothetical protein JWQ35_969 [Bacteriovoracaceae bacterium]|nr:hypothetical protein [Bacteriovoracaceae bacterium]
MKNSNQKSQKNTQQRDARAHLDHNLENTASHLGINGTETRHGAGIKSQTDAEKIFYPGKKALDQKNIK